MSQATITSIADMAKMVNEGLFNALEETVNAYCEKHRKLTLSNVELSIAAFLGSCVSASCTNETEVAVNSAAYGDFILQIAMGIMKEQSSAGETVN